MTNPKDVRKAAPRAATRTCHTAESDAALQRLRKAERAKGAGTGEVFAAVSPHSVVAQPSPDTLTD